MAFVLKGIANERAARRFTFEVTEKGSVQASIVVAVDVDLARRFGIPLQELPLLCLHLLERSPSPEKTLIFTEAEMVNYAKLRDDAKSSHERKQRLRKKRTSALVGQAWRAGTR